MATTYSIEPEKEPFLADGSSTESDDVESGADTPLMNPAHDKEEDIATQDTDEAARAGKRRRQYIGCSIVIGLLAVSAICWILLLYRHSAWLMSHMFRVTPPRLDTAYQAKSRFDIVVSMYREDLIAVKANIAHIQGLSVMPTNSRVFIYSKDDEADLSVLQDHFPNAEVMQRPNVGREGETYLHHILDNWDDIGRHTLFTQAGIYNLEELLHQIDQYFVPATGMLNLGRLSDLCDCHNCVDPYWHDNSGALAKAYEMANNASCGWLMLSYKGQFIASGARVRGAGREVYEYLHDALVDPDSWAHRPAYFGPMGMADSMNAPALGFTLERLWAGIMQCASIQVATRCARLSGFKRKGRVEDCQCFDHEPGDGFIG